MTITHELITSGAATYEQAELYFTYMKARAPRLMNMKLGGAYSDARWSKQRLVEIEEHAVAVYSWSFTANHERRFYVLKHPEGVQMHYICFKGAAVWHNRLHAETRAFELIDLPARLPRYR